MLHLLIIYMVNPPISGTNSHSDDILSTREAAKLLLRQNYPLFLAEAFITFSVSGILLTMVAMSHIIFPNEPFRALEMGVLVSSRTWAVAFSGLVFGLLADRFPRKPLFIAILILAGLGRLLNGFAPENSQWMFLTFVLTTFIVGLGQGGLMPVANSYADDAVALDMRSRFFGLFEIFRQVFQILGMVLCAFMFQLISGVNIFG